MSDKEIDEDSAEIAIIGMAGRFPGASDIWNFWDNVAAGVESIRDITPEQLAASGVPDHQIEHPRYVPRAPILEHADCFDARFFGYSPREAQAMDPQQRIFLEICWEALEHAGYNPRACDCSVGVFAGSAMNTYLLNAGLISQFRDNYLPTLFGNDKDYLATRVAFKLDLHGPAMTIQTACSSSLVAIHTACQSLLNGECDMALAGGAAIRVPLYAGHIYEEGSVFSPDGHVRAFDRDANGTVFGSGAGAIVLKPLHSALQQGDPILAVIKGSATNNDGASKSEFTAPSLSAQSDLIVEALAVAGVTADTVSCIEAHGTGTFLGDPIEIAALSRAFRTHTNKRNYCAVGSVKTNIGHLDAASGVASVIKVVLAMQNKKLPPIAGFSQPNPEIQFAESPFYVNTELCDWVPVNGIRRAGVTSIGIGGTNAHLIIDGPPTTAKQPDLISPLAQIFPIACKSLESLKQTSLRLAAHLERNSSIDSADTAATLQARAGQFRYRMAVVGKEISDVSAQFALQGQRDTHEQAIEAIETVFIFSGQESQDLSVSAELYHNYEVYRNECDACCKIMEELGMPNIGELIPVRDGANIDATSRKPVPPQFNGPALFIVEYALARLWKSFGVEPSRMIGIGVGEYVAATLAGVFNLPDALAIVAERGRLLLSVRQGSAIAPVIDKFRKFVANHQLHTPATRLMSDLTGNWILDEQAASPDYWAQRICMPQPPGRSLKTVLDNQNAVAIEISSGHSFTSPATKHCTDGDARVIVSLPETEKGKSDDEYFLQALSRFWLMGGKLDWGKIRPRRETQRVSLPGYVFEKVRHWLDPPPAGSEVTPLKNTAIKVYSPSWARVKSLQVVDSPLPEYSWLLFVSGTSSIPQLVSFLQASGSQVMTVEIGKEFNHLQPGRFIIDPHNLESYTALLKEAVNQATKPLRLLHLWNTDPAIRDMPHLFDERDRAFDSIINIFIAAERTLKNGLDLVVFTQAAQQVDGDDLVMPFRALAEPACRALAAENPDAKALVLDLAIDGIDLNTLPWATLLSLEPEVRGSLAVRRGYLWRRSYEPADAAPIVRIREGGVYLITGGLGGIGQRIAARWAHDYGAHLMVISRREFPAEELWNASRERARLPDSQRETVELFSQATQGRGTIQVLKGDITQPTDMFRIVQSILKQHGRLDGVVHAAGFFDPRFCSLKSSAEIEAVLAPKLSGTVALVHALHEIRLDFVALLSSRAALEASAGLVDYAAANVFLDAMAEAHPMDLPLISINWPIWENVGMANAVAKDNMTGTISAEEGLRLFEELLQPSARRLVLSKSNASELHLAEESQRDNRNAPSSSALDFDTDATSVEGKVVKIWSEALGADGINPEDDFFELGGSSLIATRCLASIKQEFGVKLELHVFLSAPTPRELAALIEDNSKK